MELFRTTGRIRYGRDSYSVVIVDPEIGNYYRSFIPRHIMWSIPLWQPHITVTRTGVEKIVNREAWEKYEGQEFVVGYSPHIMIGFTYIWLPAFSKELEEIRLELGLSRFFDRFRGFHITIANMKGTLSQGRCMDYGGVPPPTKNYVDI